MAGVCTFVGEGQELPVAAGQALFIPRGAVHQFQNRGTESARFLTTIEPGVLSPDYFREMYAAISAGGPPDAKRIGEIMQRHELQAVPPVKRTPSRATRANGSNQIRGPKPGTAK